MSCAYPDVSKGAAIADEVLVVVMKVGVNESWSIIQLNFRQLQRQVYHQHFLCHGDALGRSWISAANYQVPEGVVRAE